MLTTFDTHSKAYLSMNHLAVFDFETRSNLARKAENLIFKAATNHPFLVPFMKSK